MRPHKHGPQVAHVRLVHTLSDDLGAAAAAAARGPRAPRRPLVPAAAGARTVVVCGVAHAGALVGVASVSTPCLLTCWAIACGRQAMPLMSAIQCSRIGRRPRRLAHRATAGCSMTHARQAKHPHRCRCRWVDHWPPSPS
jgi:hypothetical protein